MTRRSPKKFYASLFGWTTEAFGGSTDYTLFKKGEQKVGGMMKCPKPGLPSRWLAYVLVEDADAIAARGKGGPAGSTIQQVVSPCSGGSYFDKLVATHESPAIP